jgi:DNA-binding LytR/AlgR family response regulator
MPTALIADDEDTARAQLRVAVGGAWPGLEVIAECSNGIDAWDAFLEQAPDVCLLDVRMPGLTGIEVARRIGARAHIVFLVTRGDHALDEFESREVDCILKPVDAERLARVLARTMARPALPAGAPADLQPLLEELVARVRRAAPLEVVQTGVGKALRPVRVDEIAGFESDGRGTRVIPVETGAPELQTRTPVKELAAMLDPAVFWQVHRCAIVDHRRIAAAVRQPDGSLRLTLEGRPETLPVAPHFEPLFTDR